jgi:hypothetical protein
MRVTGGLPCFLFCVSVKYAGQYQTVLPDCQPFQPVSAVLAALLPSRLTAVFFQGRLGVHELADDERLAQAARQ